MVRKPGRMYRNIDGPAYTRREYMGGVPNPKIVHFEMGNVKAKNDFPVELSLVVDEACQIRHNALEAARIIANKHLGRIGTANYFLWIRVYPHHVLREHKMATGAGADRISSGMSKAFGKAVGTAARVRSGQIVMSARVYPHNVEKAKHALREASYKLPTPCRILITRGAELVK
ncbi:MAG: 50S ribosomal protein L16 [Euryarchaeota archaeon]|nr:50S ribosomal protein L16 [Euryarchaeota archaeon]